MMRARETSEDESMARLVKNGIVRKTAAERERRDQEVLRANRELAAYFKGRRTEREARGALKIIKAYIRDRERTDPGSLRPLPGVQSGPPAKHATTRKIEPVRKRGARKTRRQVPEAVVEIRDAETQSMKNQPHLPEEPT
jgi:hypothetical protein